MLSLFQSRSVQLLVFFGLGIASCGTIQPALALPDTEAGLFREAYLEGCQEGVVNAGLEPKAGADYCACTVEKILQIPDEKLTGLGNLSEEEIMVDPEIKNAVDQCLEILQPTGTK